MGIHLSDMYRTNPLFFASDCCISYANKMSDWKKLLRGGNCKTQGTRSKLQRSYRFQAPILEPWPPLVLFLLMAMFSASCRREQITVYRIPKESEAMSPMASAQTGGSS